MLYRGFLFHVNQAGVQGFIIKANRKDKAERWLKKQRNEKYPRHAIYGIRPDVRLDKK